MWTTHRSPKVNLLAALIIAMLLHTAGGVCVYGVFVLQAKKPAVMTLEPSPGTFAFSIVPVTDEPVAPAASAEPPAPPPPPPEEPKPEPPPPPPIPLPPEPEPEPADQPSEMAATEPAPPVVDATPSSVPPTQEPVPAAATPAAAGSGTAAPTPQPAPPGAPTRGVEVVTAGLSQIQPHYPLGSRLRNEEGSVSVKVAVNGKGRAERVDVVQSSGYPALDRAAVDAVKNARFTSASGSGPVGGDITLSFRFKLVN
jgi:periplasmic protein TonB